MERCSVGQPDVTGNCVLQCCLLQFCLQLESSEVTDRVNGALCFLLGEHFSLVHSGQIFLILFFTLSTIVIVQSIQTDPVQQCEPQSHLNFS